MKKFGVKDDFNCSQMNNSCIYLPKTVVLEWIVASHDHKTSCTQTQGKEDLSGRITPSL